MGERKPFGTPVDVDIRNLFKAECKKQGFEMNEAIEILMKGFISGDIRIEKKISYEIHQKEN